MKTDHCSWGSVVEALHEDPHMLDDYCKNSRRRPQEVESVEDVEIVETIKIV
jgi:hypothetical protein